MMAAYQPQQPGGMHPSMVHGHPGMSNPPGGQMGHPMMQQGVSGPGQPHVTQAGAMMGMQPGANGIAGGGMPGGQHMAMGMPGQGGQPGQPMPGGAPNAHAIGHMTQQQMLQQQQMQQGMPPQMMQQHQAVLMRQRQLAAQAQASGMMGMQQGMQQGMQGMTPQQMMQLQQQNAGSHLLPPHLRQQQMHTQQRYMEQTQQAQMQQQMAMQQGNSQQGAQGQAGPPTQPGQPHPQQMRPQSRMANAGEQAQGQQQGQAGAQGQAQPNQGGQANQQPPNQQAQAQNAGPQAQQPGQPQTMTPQQMQQVQLQRQRQMMMQQQQMQRQAAAQQQSISGILILRLMLFADQLSAFGNVNGKDIAAWNEFVDKHFAPEGRLLHSFDDGPSSKTKTYEVLRPTIARYFWTYFESGAHSLKLHTENAREQALPNGRSQVACANATLTVSYPSGARLEMHGTLNVQFSGSQPNSTNMIECLEIQQNSAEEIVSRAEIEKILNNWSPSVSTKSPKMTKNKLPKAQQKLQQQSEAISIENFPKAPKGSMGVTSRVQQFLEIGETMNVMSELMSFANEKKMRPEQALESLVQQYEAQGPQGLGNPQINLQQHGSPMIQRTPSMQNMQMQGQGNFSSPSVSNMSLPMQNGMNGSPHIANHAGLQPGMGMQANSHTPSPHQSNMAAPQMMPQHSQQGTNSSVASANTSPNVNNANKRRRSTVKNEDDGVDGNAQNRVKPSPRMNKKAKPGG